MWVGQPTFGCGLALAVNTEQGNSWCGLVWYTTLSLYLTRKLGEVKFQIRIWIRTGSMQLRNPFLCTIGRAEDQSGLACISVPSLRAKL